MNKFVIGSFATIDTEYHNILDNKFLPSCKKFGFNLGREILTVGSKNYGNWYRNVAEKPNIILYLLNKAISKECCLVFLDADATIEKYPQLFHEIPEEYDIAFHTLNWNRWYGYKQVPPVKELLTGTMFFRNTQAVKELCKEWYDEAIKTKDWEQKVLQRIIKKHAVKIYPLPLEYCYMKTRPRNREPLVKLDPVILHHQVSRFLKRKLK